MVPDEEAECFGCGRLELEAIDRRLREPQALARVAVIASGADVVQEQRQRQQLRRAKFFEESREPGAGRAPGIPQHLHPAKWKNGVHGSGMSSERIGRGAMVNLVELRKKTLEKAALGHLEQARRNARARPQQIEDRGAIVVTRQEILGGEAAEIRVNAAADLVRYRLAVRDRRSERLEPDGRLQRGGVWMGETNAVGRNYQWTAGRFDGDVRFGWLGHLYGLTLHPEEDASRI
jgi:hypothetical protein